MNALTTGIASLVAGFSLMSPANAVELTPPRNGWSSWQVEAVDGAPDMCCWGSWDDRGAPRTACALDDDHGNTGTRDHATTAAVRVYVRTAGGKVERLRVFSATCQVKAATPIAELGNITTEDSARWLIGLGKQDGKDSPMRGEFTENVMAALAMHRGDVAGSALNTFARSDPRAEMRKKAIFWLALLRGPAGAEVASSVMFGDKDADVRKHAAFAITQSTSPSVASDLIRLGNTDTDGDVRSQAWFWLAQTGATKSEEAIIAALRKDSDAHVREQAIFALSQLPDERATRALVSVAEDQSLSREQRKRAMFWLAQSDSEGAQNYLEKILVGKSAD
jgi:hypothetical protein